MDCKGLFAQQFWKKIQIRWTICFVVIPFLTSRLLQIFAHDMAAQPLCHVQNFIVITASKFGWEQNQISGEFQSWWTNLGESSPQELIIKDYRDLKEYQNKQGHMAAGIGWPPTTLRLRQNGPVLQTAFSNAFSWMKISVFSFKFQRSLFLRVWLTICLHWFRYWLDSGLATDHYLNQNVDQDVWCHMVLLGHNELRYISCEIVPC